MRKCLLFLYFFIYLLNMIHSENLYKIKANKKWGFIDNTGKVIIKPKFDSVYSFSEGLAFVFINNNYYFINEKGEKVIELPSGNYRSFHNGLASFNPGSTYKGIEQHMIMEGKKWGFINKKGEVVIEPIYDKVGNFYEGVATVTIGFGDNEKNGYIDKTGNYILNPQKQIKLCGRFSDGVAVIIKDRIYYLINKLGNIIKELKYDRLSPYGFKEGLMWAKLGRKYGAIDIQGNLAISLKYRIVTYFSEGLCKVRLNGKYYYIDKTEKVVIKVPENYYCSRFSEGLATVEVGYTKIDEGKWKKYKSGFMNRQGQIVIEPQYKKVWDFEGGLAKVKTEDWWGYINKKEKIIWKTYESEYNE